MRTALTCAAIVAACGWKTRRCVGVEGGRVQGDSCGRDGRRGFQRGRSGGLQGFCSVRRTPDSDKRSIQPSFTPLAQSRRDKRKPQKQIRLKTRNHRGNKVSGGSLRVQGRGPPTMQKRQGGGRKAVYRRHKIQVLPLLWFKSDPGKRPLDLLRKVTQSHRDIPFGRFLMHS